MELLEKVLSKENLNNTYKQVYKNKGASGSRNKEYKRAKSNSKYNKNGK